MSFSSPICTSKASSNQKELETVLHQAEVFRGRNETLTKELTLSRGTARQLRDELAERADEYSVAAVEVRAISYHISWRVLAYNSNTYIVSILLLFC